VIIVINAMRQGPSQRRLRELSKRFGADERTIARWQVFWRHHSPQTSFWKVARARLTPLLQIVALPNSLLNAFLRYGADDSAWAKLIRFLAPITITEGLPSKSPDDLP
jgi:hypothetical protein